MHEFLKVSYTLAPLLVGLAFHGLCIKFGWLGRLARPIDAGATLRGKCVFGPNKTYRGVLVVAVDTAAGVGVQILMHRAGVGRQAGLLDYGNAALVGLGFAVGAAAMLGELPNSLLKRQLSIPPGTTGGGALGAVFYVLDQIDMLVGVWAVLGLVVAVTAARVLWSVVFLFVAHQALTAAGYRLGMRATAR
jgi:CDP-archaeol synthase